MAVVVITATGHPFYGLSAHQAVQSVIDHTDFEVIVGCDDANAALMPCSERVRLARIGHIDHHRADPFLSKFDVWRRCLDMTTDEVIVHLDADAVIVRPITHDDLVAALGSGHLAMVEQTAISGSSMDRNSFHEHHLAHSHEYLVTMLSPPPVHRFRFHNSGVVIFLRTELRNLVDWADELRRDRPGHHRVGDHMIADQDYLQVWTNTVRPDACTDLDPTWNHCPVWDHDFPRTDARIVHLSNFCNGPDLNSALELQRLRRASLEVDASDRWTDVSFCVITHRSGDVIGGCIDALLAFAGAEIVVVDNASDDGTVDAIETRGIAVHRYEENRGYAAGANRAAALATRPVLVFVNPDCFLHLGALEGLVDRLQVNTDLVLAADVVHEDGRMLSGVRDGYTAGRLLSDLVDAPFVGAVAATLDRRGNHDDASWKWPLGTCLAIRRDTFRRVGGFDEQYFVYMEDVEFGHALHAAGCTIDSLPTAVVHLGARGAAVDDARRAAMLTHARLSYTERHHGRPLAMAMRSAHRVTARVRRSLDRRRSMRR